MGDYYEDLPTYEANSPEDVQHDAQVLIDAFIQPVQNADAPTRPPSATLPMPFCLPQIGSGFDTPFARGYSPVLEQVGIPQETFLDFVDGLNMAMISSPPLQVVNVAGLIIGFVPHWTFVLAGALMQTGARVGMHVMSKTLSDRYLRAANARLFAPLGLRVRLCKTAALRKLVDHPLVGTPEPSKLKKLGQGAGDVILHLPFPLMKRAVRFFMEKPPPIDPGISDPLTRRLLVMQGYTLPVEHGSTLPPPASPKKILDKMNGFSVGRRQKKSDKSARDAAARRQILAGMPVTASGGGRISTVRDYHTRAMVTLGGRGKVKDQVKEDALREHRANEKLIWLVILNEADDAKIAGTEAMDNSSDDVALDDRQLEETRAEYLEETEGEALELEYFDPQPQASGSGTKPDEHRP